MSKTEVIRFRATTGEKAAITSQAGSEGITVTELVEKALGAYLLEHSEEYRQLHPRPIMGDPLDEGVV